MKKIALVMEGWGRYITDGWVKGVLEQINKEDEDINLYIFNAFASWSTDSLFDQGEHSIFFLPDFCDFDGIIVELNNTRVDSVREEVLQKIRDSKVPAIILNRKEEGFILVATDNYNSMYGNIRFLHEEKGCKKFWFVMGPEENYENQQRAKALLDYSKEQGLKEKVDYFIDYSDYEIRNGKAAFCRLFKYDIPDAIICANDNLAVGILEEAEKLGLECPKDFYITGFDDLDKARFFQPRISTISYERREAACTAVSLLRDIWNGKKVPEENYIGYTPIYWESCDCESDIEVNERAQMKGNIIWNENRSQFERDVMRLSSRIIHADSIKELMSGLQDVVTVSKCEDIVVILDPDFWSQYESGETDWIKGKDYDNAECMKHLFPAFESEKSGECFLFQALHFREQCVGYIVFKNAQYLMEQQFLFDIMNTIWSGLEILYQKKWLTRVNSQLAELSVRDALTGLYNRMGFGKYAYQKISDGHKDGKKMLILYSDLDLLKYINDNCGHEAGDEAIICAANELKSHASAEGMCFRLGGDEFLIIDEFKNEDSVKQCIEDIRKDLVNVSKKKDLQYNLSMSFGYVVSNPSDNLSLDDYISKADVLMYEDKRSRRQNRR
ncbi:MAG: GGDEF domain-containing protein [Butyrivibrio sp.]|nr:GGDEF domain-containing protein [Butyrivibrio sp.]